VILNTDWAGTLIDKAIVADAVVRLGAIVGFGDDYSPNHNQLIS
jgi:hypothetical protein